MVNNRLKEYLETNNLLDENQSGFRTNHSTTDHIVRFQQAAAKSQRSGYLCAIFLDLSKAFDLVWTDGLMYKLANLGLTGNIYNWIRSFLTDRRIQVSIGNHLSSEKRLDNGTPQGSVISPTLFNVMVNDIKHYLPKDVTLAAYADDCTIWRYATRFGIVEEKMQTAINRFSKWANDWGFIISTTKTTGMIINQDPSTKQMKIKINGDQIRFQDTTKLLGVTFDRKLTWKPHFNNIINSSNQILNMMRMITGKTWGANRASLLTIYRALIRSRLEYGCPAFLTATPTQIRRLEAIQYKALLIASGTPPGVRREALLQELGELPLRLRFQESPQILQQIAKSPTPTPTLRELQKYRLTRKRIKTVGQAIHELRSQYGIDRLTVAPRQPTNFPNGIYQSRNQQYPDKHDRQTQPTNGSQVYRPRLPRTHHRGRTQIYTDGSHDPVTSATGYGIYIPDKKFETCNRLPNQTSVFTAEIQAILDSFTWISTQPPAQYLVLTDSLSSIQAIESSNTSTRPELVNQIRQLNFQLTRLGIHVTLLWIPSHVGIPGNEKADQLAREGLKLPEVTTTLPHSISEANNLLRKTINSQWETHLVDATPTDLTCKTPPTSPSDPCTPAGTLQNHHKIKVDGDPT
ncbi:uncharacterized protein [Gossypium hirsutum]|uniref:RNA-directed DNA polymerase from mobile element jockey n=1 Tax=Gossypium hirsutum TaxID=3635 RepID=A0ABM3BHE3_GOSHI|nr:uncharacterized protein LOC121226908 [Gossypium hirsutum]